MPDVNRQWLLASRPVGLVSPANFEWRESPLPKISDGQALVRTLFPEYGSQISPVVRLDTPSLLGLHDKLEFLHNGRAHELGEVLDKYNAANRHGDTAALSDRERLALTIFLESL